MPRLALIASLAATPLLFPLPAPLVAPPLGDCVDDLPHQPVVVYEVSGFTFVGFFDRELVVYQDGSARLSSASAAGDGKAQVASVAPGAAVALLSDLSAAGAFQLCDQTGTFNDLPLSTLTVVRPQTDARAHTFSWWAGDGAYGPVEQRLNQFIAAAFPGF